MKKKRKVSLFVVDVMYILQNAALSMVYGMIQPIRFV